MVPVSEFVKVPELLTIPSLVNVSKFVKNPILFNLADTVLVNAPIELLSTLPSL